MPKDCLNPKDLLGNYQIGTVVIPIYGSLSYTYDQANRRFDDRWTGQRDLITSYAFISGDSRSALPMRAVREAMLYEVQLMWYQMSGNEVPAQVASRAEEAMAKAQNTEKQAEEQAQAATKEKGPRVTIRGIIENGLLAGKSEEDILAEVKEHKPNAKADGKHVAYYRHFLIKAGKMEKPAKAPKAEKAPKPEPQEAAAQPGARKKNTQAQQETQAVAAPSKGGPKPGRESKSTAKAGR